MVWLLINFCFFMNECNVSLRFFFFVVRHNVDNSEGFENSDVKEVVVKVVYNCYFSS